MTITEYSSALRNAITKLANESEGQHLRELARGIVDFPLEQDDYAELAITGAAKLIADELASRRSARPLMPGWTDEEELITYHDSRCASRHSRLELIIKCSEKHQFWDKYGTPEEARHKMLGELAGFTKDLLEEYVAIRLQEIMLADAEGKQRKLINFRREDITYWEKKSSTNSATWSARQKWFLTAAQSCDEYGVDEVSELPPPVIIELGDLADRTWTR